MRRRPWAVVVLSCLLIVSGLAGLAFHASEFSLRPLPSDVVWAGVLRLAAIVCGIFMLRGDNWARWLAILWIAFHVVISVFNSVPQLVMHIVIFAIFALCLCSRPANKYFGARQPGTA